MVDGLAITGPTAAGKTDLAIAVAERLAGEIISMDSRQVYRGMDVGTAKPSAAQCARIPHFGIDIISPAERYNAGRFGADARKWISEISSRGHVAVLAGGTGFFLRALTHPMFPEPALDVARKERLKRTFEQYSREELLRWLRVLDEHSAMRMAAEGGPQRLARAVEVALLTGRPLSEWQADAPDQPALRFRTFVLDLPREVLYQRINRRVEQMIDGGLVTEVEALLAAGFDEHSPGMNAVGYIELIAHLRGEKPLDQAVDEIQRATRRYARRQITWFRHQLPDDALRLDGTLPTNELVETIQKTFTHP